MTARIPAAAPRPKPRRPGRPKGGHLLADRSQLLGAAARVIAARGPDVTLDDIAAEANVSKPILYRTIGDKDALLTALSELLVDRIGAAAAAAAASAPAGDHRRAFEAAIGACLRTIEAERHLFIFVNAGPGTESFRRLVDRSARPMVELFGAARTAAGSDPAPARTRAYAVVGAIQVVATMWFGDPFGDLDQVGRDLAQLMWSGLSGADEASTRTRTSGRTLPSTAPEAPAS